MKKIFTILTFAIVMLSGKIYSQSNLTWIFNDKAEQGQGFFKTKTDFNISVVGLKDQAAATAMVEKMKSNKDVASCTNNSKDASGNYIFLLKMTKAQDKVYYANWAEQLGIAYFEVNGNKKVVADLKKATK